ncbi:MAG: 6-bladed beta-propeller [Vicinamibacterales bacterium]
MRMRAGVIAAAAAVVIGGFGVVSVSTQQRQPSALRVPELMSAFDYDVVPNWGLPYPKPGYAWGSVPGVFVESDDRIFLASRGEIKEPSSLPADYKGFLGAFRQVLNAPDNEVRGCIRIVDSTGKVLEIWSQWDKLFEGTNGPHKIKISPYDSERRVWVVGETKNVIYVFSNDGKQLLKTLGVEGETAEDATHFGKPQDLAFLPDGSVLVADGLTNARVVKLDRNGRFVSAFGSHGTGDGQFNAVHGVDVDKNGHIYVVDRLNKRVQVFDANGKHLMNWPNIRFPNHVQVTEPVPGDRSTNGGQVVWVADNQTTDVMKFDTNGRQLFSWHASGPVPGGFGELHQFSVDSKGNVYTGDNILGRPQKLAPKAGADPSHLIGQSLPLMPKTK